MEHEINEKHEFFGGVVPHVELWCPEVLNVLLGGHKLISCTKISILVVMIDSFLHYILTHQIYPALAWELLAFLPHPLKPPSLLCQA